MKSENLPEVSDEQYDPNLDAQDEEVTSGGNNKLLYILIAGLLVLIFGYVALPKGNGNEGGLTSVTPSFMLDDAAVTATSPTAADSIAAGLKAVPVPASVDDEKDEKVVAKIAVTRPVATSVAPVAVAADAPAAAPVAAVPEPVAVAPVAAPEPVAPTNVTMSGKIDDENGRPMVGATVMLKGSNKATSTDANGNYSLEIPAGIDNTLMYGYGGYDDEVVRSRGTQPVNVTLTPRAKAGRKRR